MIKNYAFVLTALLIVSQATAQPAFTDGTAMLGHTANSGGCMAVTDMDGDGLDDVVQLDFGTHVYVLYQETDGSFTTVDYGSLDNSSQWGWAIGDLDNDGHKDICGGATGQQNFLSITARGVSSFSNLDGPSIFTQCMSMGDMNNDGRTDIFACHDNGPPNIWFTNASGVPVNSNSYIDWSTSPSSDMSGNYGSCFVDFDNDGDLDLYIAHCRQGVNSSDDPRRWNRLFVNDGTNHYTDQAAEYGVQDHEQTWTSDFGDYDNDGDLDMFSNEHSTGTQLFENDGTGHYTNVTAGSGLGVASFPLQGMFRDMDNDGFLDILIAGGSEFYYKGNGDGTFTLVEGLFPSSKAMHGFAFGDLNRDGFEDVYANYGSGYVDGSAGNPDRLWLNTPNGNHFFRVRLQGTTSNRDAIGARVTITGPWGTQIREVRSGESYGLVNSFILPFGLGAETIVPTVTVRWPSGLVETFNDLNADQTITVVEGTCVSPNVAISASPSAIICPSSGPVLLTASPGTDFTWNTGATGPTLSVDQAGAYWIMTGTGTCTTQANVNVLESPDETPTVSAAGPTTICPLDQVVLTASPASGYLWSNGSDQQSITVSAAGNYTVTIEGACAAFTSEPVEVTLLNAPAAPVSEDVSIPVAGTAVLTATGDSIIWYDAEVDGTPVGYGSPWTTPFVDTNTLFWCSDLGQNGGVPQYGGKTDKSDIGTYQNNATYYNYFSTYEDMVIKSAKVYANGAGERPIAVVDQGTGNIVASGNFFIPDGESRVQLDLLAPGGGAYALRIVSGDPQLWRDGVGSNPVYPYDLGGLGAITGCNAGSANYYYYFYNWEVASPASWCEGPRTPVEVLVGPTGVAPDGQAEGLRVFPNPATDKVTISGKLPEGAATAEFLDVAGRVCLRAAITPAGVTIDVSSLAPGAYTLQLRGEDGISNTAFVKR
ncbi:MAG: VCBS repeat-containing protein [Flavobacteriales bacterium]|nr:VCBS repeat-containing protein [Flavobacteriales bacterium]